MKRREEIEKAAHQKYPYEGGTLGMICERSIPTFIQGAEWADKTMIEKACEYLRRHMYSTPIFEHDEDENPVNYVCASCCDSVEEFIENFRKSMEE